ncbi:thioredoxin-like protein, partial [Auricularia subglabra TFB-10046 SS5]
MSAPIEVTSVAQWETALSDAKAAGRTVFVDFHAEWCVPCKSIAPYFALLAAQHPGVTWLRVDIEDAGTKPIAVEHKVTMMPYFLAIRDGAVVSTVRGADPRTLTALATKY